MWMIHLARRMRTFGFRSGDFKDGLNSLQALSNSIAIASILIPRQSPGFRDLGGIGGSVVCVASRLSRVHSILKDPSESSPGSCIYFA